MSSSALNAPEWGRSFFGKNVFSMIDVIRNTNDAHVVSKSKKNHGF